MLMNPGNHTNIANPSNCHHQCAILCASGDYMLQEITTILRVEKTHMKAREKESLQGQSGPLGVRRGKGRWLGLRLGCGRVVNRMGKAAG